MTWDIAVIGAGYVGMPHAQTFAEAGQKVVLMDVQQHVVDGINRGESHIKDVSSEVLKKLVDTGLITASTDYAVVSDSNAVVIAVPTPLTDQRVPDLTYIESAARSIAPYIRNGHVVVLESTTYPGTTREILRPILEAGSGLKAGEDFYLAFAPERVDPGRLDWTTKTTPKVVGGINPASTKAAAHLYRTSLDYVYEVSTADAAELRSCSRTSSARSTSRSSTSFAQLCDRMGIDVWEVVDAAATKPFGFMSFKPGPGPAGTASRSDPYYLAWKAREFDFNTRSSSSRARSTTTCRTSAARISQALNHGAQSHSRARRC